MDTNLNKNMKELARQLSCPEGEDGIKTGELMNIGNENMIKRTIDLADITEKDTLLEIGHGNGAHVAYLFKKANPTHYYGIDISETMIKEAQRINVDLITANKASFGLSNGENLPYSNNFFDKIFTVNTLYFWKDPKVYAAEIYRILKPNGKFCLTFAEKSFMEQLPFTQYGFQLYDIPLATALLKDVSFVIENIIKETEETTSNTGQAVKRDIVIIIAQKQESCS